MTQRQTFPPPSRTFATESWPQAIFTALTRLRRSLRRAGALSVASCTRIALHALPAEHATRMRRRFALLEATWPSGRPAFDALDAPALRRLFAGAARDFARLALFGPPGQGGIHDARHREQLYNRLSAEILRSCRDDNSLRYVSDRAMNHPDVIKDPLLSAMLRSFINEREQEFRTRMYSQRTEAERSFPAWSTPSAPPAARGTPDRPHVRASFERIRHEFEGRLVHYDVATAERVFERLESMHKRYPDMVSDAEISRCRVDLARVAQRRQTLESEITQVAERAVRAAGQGRSDVVAGLLRRLTMFQSAGPHVFPETRRREIEERVAAASDVFEHREAAGRLLELERRAAREVRRMADSVRRFHETVRRSTPDSPEFALAEREYAATIADIRAHDSEWLAELMIELDERLEEFHDVTGRAEAQVTDFLRRVRHALNRVREEVKEINRERSAAAPPAPPAADAAPLPDSPAPS